MALRRYRATTCRHCGETLPRHQTRCSKCRRITEYGRQLYLAIAIRTLFVVAGFIFVFVQLPRILAAFS